MRTRRSLMTGIAAAALALAAWGIAVGSGGGTPGGNATSVSARHAPADTWVIYEEDLAQVKRHITWKGGDRAGAQRPQTDTSWFTYQQDLAKVKRDAVLHAWQQARGR